MLIFGEISYFCVMRWLACESLYVGSVNRMKLIGSCKKLFIMGHADRQAIPCCWMSVGKVGMESHDQQGVWVEVAGRQS